MEITSLIPISGAFVPGGDRMMFRPGRGLVPTLMLAVSLAGGRSGGAPCAEVSETSCSRSTDRLPWRTRHAVGVWLSLPAPPAPGEPTDSSVVGDSAPGATAAARIGRAAGAAGARSSRMTWMAGADGRTWTLTREETT